MKLFNTVNGANIFHEGNPLKVSKGDPSLEGEDLYLFSIKYSVSILPLKESSKGQVRFLIKSEILVSHFTFSTSPYL